jgi:hypothetical protein
MTRGCRTREQCLAWLRDTARPVEPGQDVDVALFRPEDAEGVARLYHAVYGDTFPIDYVYDPALIREANAGPDLHQIVARTPRGDVVGLSALFRVAPGEGVLESGALMILPEYRLGMLLFRLMDLTHEVAAELGLNAVFGQSVTDHLTTQKINRRYGYQAFAFEIESMPPRPDGAGGRISLLDEFVIARDRPHAVYPPLVYEGFLRALYAKTGLERSFLPGVEPEGQTACAVSAMPSASLAKAAVAAVGIDFAGRVRAMEAAHPGQHVYQLQLPMSHPALPWAVEQARALGYGLGGLLPLWTDRDVLLMQKVAGTPDFDAPAILTEQAGELVAYVRADREGLAGL